MVHPCVTDLPFVRSVFPVTPISAMKACPIVGSVVPGFVADAIPAGPISVPSIFI